MLAEKKGFTSVRVFFVLFLFIFISACTKEEEIADLSEKKLYNVAYGIDSRHSLNVYLPANRNGGTPFLVLIHGGGWGAGDKSDLLALQDSLLKRGIASASINYRYASESVHYKSIMQDINDALLYCMDQGDEWYTRTERFLMVGFSAGGHLALLYSYKYDTNQRISAVVSAAGPTNLTNTDWLNFISFSGQIQLINNIVGADYIPGQQLDAKFAAASPVYNLVNKKPTLLIHGDKDSVVFYSQSQALTAVLNNAGVSNKLVTIQNGNHDLNVGDSSVVQLILDEIKNWSFSYGG